MGFIALKIILLLVTPEGIFRVLLRAWKTLVCLTLPVKIDYTSLRGTCTAKIGASRHVVLQLTMCSSNRFKWQDCYWNRRQRHYLGSGVTHSTQIEKKTCLQKTKHFPLNFHLGIHKFFLKNLPYTI